MWKSLVTTLPVFILSTLLLIPSGFAQYNPDGLFQFSGQWQQPVNETNFDFNLVEDAQIDEKDLLLLIEEWIGDSPMATHTPTSTFSPTSSPTPSATFTPTRTPTDIPTNTPLSTATPTETPDTGDEITITLPGGVTLDMVKIPSGSFIMGSPSDEQHRGSYEGPQHQVNIGYDFYMGKYEVTKAQWQAVMGTTPWSWRSYVLDDPNSPAVYVSWNDAQAFVTALNQLGQGTFRLPSEAEWEYACRAGTTTRFYWGDDPNYSQIDDYAWWGGNAWDANERYAHVVGQKLPNAYGLYDMSGNVWEWCQDWYHSDYNGAPSDGSAWESPSSSYRVVRGGLWSSSAQYCRSAIRSGNGPDYASSNFGFRLVRTQ